MDFFGKLFSIHRNEWSEVSFAWTLRFLVRFGFVMGWTVVLALFVARFGIGALPYFFIVSAVFSIVGSIFYSLFSEYVKDELLIAMTVVLIAVGLMLANAFADNVVMFFSLLIACIGLFMSQLDIILDDYIEKMFTPLMSERVFPFIEAAETVAGILAGFLIVMFAGKSVNDFIALWIASLLLVIPALVLFGLFGGQKKLLNGFGFNKIKSKKNDLVMQFRQLFKNGAQGKFVLNLLWIVFFQWVLFNLIDFQYTSMVYENSASVISDAGGGLEHAFVHDLGAFFMLFSFSALVVQLVVGGKLMRYLGVVGGMLLHVIVTILSVIGMFFSFNMRMAVLMKNNFTITGILNTSAYHTSYYALHGMNFRRLLDGMVRPIGAAAGIGVLAVLQGVLDKESFMVEVAVLILIFSVVLLYFVVRHRGFYTKLALDQLKKKNSMEVRLNAVEILSQQGHLGARRKLVALVHDEKEDLKLRKRAEKALRDLDCTEDLRYCFADKEI